MCTNLKYIFTRSRFISPFHDERLLVPIKCGRCYECQAQSRNEWYYRIYHEWLSTLENGGYVFFDTLTYADDYLPHMSEFFDIPIPKSLDFPCFCYEDLRYFFVRLRRNLSYLGYNVANCLRYFLSSEYGTADVYRDERGVERVATHRPHYHVLFFITDSSLDVHTLRHAVDDAWFFGRTDRVRLFGKHSNYFTSNNHDDISTRSVASYVAKYVQKLSSFQSEIDFRIIQFAKVLFQQFTICDVLDSSSPIDYGFSELRFYPSNLATKLRFRLDESFYSWIHSANGSKVLQDIKRLMNQFHRQSKGFGVSALRDIDLNQLMDTGCLTMPDSLSVSRSIPLPMYYERKLFQEQIIVDGHKMWQTTLLGKLYKRAKLSRTYDYLVKRFHVLSSISKYYPDVKPSELARYCVYYRYRCDGQLSEVVNVQDKLKLPNIVYNYSTPSDRMLFHEACVTRHYVGMSGNYYAHSLDDAIPIRYFLAKHMIVNYHYEDILLKYDAITHRLAVDKQLLFDYLAESRNRKQSQLSLF